MVRKKYKSRKYGKNSWFKENIFNFVFLALFIGFFVWLFVFDGIATLRNIKQTQLPPGLKTILENPDDTTDCSLSISPKNFAPGTTISGTLRDGANTFCQVYGLMEGDDRWLLLYEGNTNDLGVAVHNEDWWVEGIFHIRAVCDLNGNGKLDSDDCISNEQVLTCSSSPDCVDSDGDDRYTPGHVTTSDDTVYDVCSADNTQVLEYYCDDTLGLQGHYLNCDADQSCYSTRSGGYCRDSDSGGWSPGDEVYGGSGDSGISGGTLPVAVIDLNDYGFIPGGTCSLKVRLHSYWDYSDPAVCQGYVAAQALKWTFYDSTGLIWERTDLAPPSNLDQIIVPLPTPIWDGQNDWKLMVTAIYQIPGCNVYYHYDLKIIIDDCD